jgi:hypothetical protein
VYQSAIKGYKFKNFLIFYFGSIMNDYVGISEIITHKIKKGNKAYYACKKLINSILINKFKKRIFYMTLIKPEVI